MKLRKIFQTRNILRSSTTVSTPMPMPRRSAPISKPLRFWQSRVTKSARLKALDFLWDHCRCPDGGMFHYFDGAAHVPGLLNDQARMGTALLKAHRATAEAEISRTGQRAGRVYSVAAEKSRRRLLRPRRTGTRLPELSPDFDRAKRHGGIIFLALAEATGDFARRDAALWALNAFTGDFNSYGIHAAGFGQALNEFMNGR